MIQVVKKVQISIWQNMALIYILQMSLFFGHTSVGDVHFVFWKQDWILSKNIFRGGNVGLIFFLNCLCIFCVLWSVLLPKEFLPLGSIFSHYGGYQCILQAILHYLVVGCELWLRIYWTRQVLNQPSEMILNRRFSEKLQFLAKSHKNGHGWINSPPNVS